MAQRNGHREKIVALSPKAVLALKGSEAYRGNALVRRLVETIESGWNLNETREERLRELERKNEELSMAVEKPRVLIVLYANGSVSAYSNDKLDLRIVNFPNTKAERAWEYFLTTMPRRYAELYDVPYYREGGHVGDCLTPAEILERMDYRAAMRKLAATCEAMRTA